MNSNIDTDLHRMSYYVVAFIDLLGQREKLLRLNRLPDSDNKVEQESFFKNVYETIDAVKSLQSYFTSIMQGLIKSNEEPEEKLSEDTKALYQKLTTSNVGMQRFSDGVVLFVPLRDDPTSSPYKGIWGLIGSIAALQIISLSQGLPFRGGIDLGLGVEMAPNELYGPVISQAYHLESEVAQYPRVVIGNEFITYMGLLEKEDVSSLEGAAALQMASLWKQLIVKDIDGYYITDYLGEGFQQHILTEMSDSLEAKGLVQKALGFINGEIDRFSEHQNSKMAFRYSLLFRYFAANLHRWQHEVDDKGS